MNKINYEGVFTCFRQTLDTNQFKWFIHGDKPSFEIDLSSANEKDLDFFGELMVKYLQITLNRKIWMDECGTFFSKNKVKYLEESDNNFHYKSGKMFGFPSCCIKKYCGESNDRSLNSAKRYLNQCKEMKIKKDIFEIGLLNDAGICSKYGFIPCSPKCKNALKIVKSLRKFK